MLSASLMVIVVALVFFLVSVVLAFVTSGAANPMLWALWALCVLWIIGALAGVKLP